MCMNMQNCVVFGLFSIWFNERTQAVRTKPDDHDHKHDLR